MAGLADRPHAIPTGDRPPYRRPCRLSCHQGYASRSGDNSTSGETDDLSSGALACSCRLPAGALGGVFSPCRLFVTLDRQPEPGGLMASSALSIKEDILAALKDILMRHLPAPEIRPSPIDGLVLVRREDPPLTAVSKDRWYPSSSRGANARSSAHRNSSSGGASSWSPASTCPARLPSSIRPPGSPSSPSSSTWTGRS